MGVVIVACARRILPSARNVSELLVTELQVTAIAVSNTSVRRWRIEASLIFDSLTGRICKIQDGSF
jgi:hypothetical protein